MKPFEQLVHAQQTFFLSGKTRCPQWRLNALKKLHTAIVRFEPQILDALHKDLKKNPFEAYASEIGIVMGEIRSAKKLIKRYATPNRKPTPAFLWPSHSAELLEPLGVCLIIAPWNYPFQLTMAPLINALAAGNCAVVKPSERSVHTSQIISQILNEIFEPQYVTTVIADRHESAALLVQPFDKFFFTGSKQVGEIIYRAAAARMIPVTLELGGKNPCIVLNDANIEAAARRIVWGKFFNAGQTCVAPDYLLVQRPVAERLLSAVKQEIALQFGTNPAQSPGYGCLIDEHHLARLTQLLQGTTPAYGGDIDLSKRYLAPTLVTKIKWDHPLMADEIFGPILPVFEFDALEDVFARVRSLPKSLALYLFSQNKKTQENVFSSLLFGGGCINDTLIHFSSPHLSVGGVGASGIGRYRGIDGYRVFSNSKSIVRSPIRPHLQLRYPPFPPWKNKLLKKVMN